MSNFSSECRAVTRKFTRADNYIHCENCNRTIYRSPSKRALWKHHFCSRACAGKYRKLLLPEKTVYRFVYKPQRALLVSTEIAQALKTGQYPEYK